MPTLKAILLTIALGLALVVAAPDTAQAAPPSRDVTYTYYSQTLTDADGSTGVYDVIGFVRYSPDGTAYTRCTYAQRVNGIQTPRGTYRVEYAIANTSKEGVRQFCVENFPNRTLIVV
jgi:hypothetical protein